MDEPPKPLQVSASDSIGVNEALGLQSFGPDGEAQGGRVVDRGDSLSVDIRGDGTVPVRVEGTAKSGSDSEDEVMVCQILVDRLNSEGGRWAEAMPAEKGPKEKGIDVIAKHRDIDKNGQLKSFQVTRVVPDPELWSDLGNTGVAEKTYPSVDAVADGIYDAINKKLDKPQNGIILVLEATQLSIGLPSVCDAFEKHYGAWLRQLKFEEVWIVGTFNDNAWTCRLSTK